MGLVNFLVGLALLTLGRRLFWLFVACVGFVAGVTSVQQAWGAEPDFIAFAIAGVAGLIGALLAIFFQGLAIGLAGFIAGGYSAFAIMNLFGLGALQLFWLLCVIGGIIGVILVFVIFDWTLIVLSSLIGAALIAQFTELSSRLEALIFLILMASGVLFQARLLGRKPSEGSSET